MDLRLGFFASGKGSNVKAILDNIENKTLDAEAKVIISNNLGAGVFDVVVKHKVPRAYFNEQFYPSNYDSVDEEILDTLNKHDVNLILLAGYLKPISKQIIDAYPNRILNIHPSLLPAYGGQGMYGKNVHKMVIKSPDKKFGASVHIVTEKYDQGKVIGSCSVLRYENDTAETLGERILQFEHVLYSQVLRDIKKGIIKL